MIMSETKYPFLTFSRSGWCPELNCSYFQGPFQPKTKEQYEALKKYADGGAEPAKFANPNQSKLQKPKPKAKLPESPAVTVDEQEAEIAKSIKGGRK